MHMNLCTQIINLIKIQPQTYVRSFVFFSAFSLCAICWELQQILDSLNMRFNQLTLALRVSIFLAYFRGELISLIGCLCLHNFVVKARDLVYPTFICFISFQSENPSIMSDSLRSYGLQPPGSSVHGILQARILEWVTIPFSKGSSQPRDQTLISCIAGRFFTV